ncbi:MAG: Cof-type HAD-IIB family hydrolase [Candidatus Izemoplasma sp.]|nr:Cof-type HAD-IIB family hydrolase [Candidatus Izemoplasma sp.]
MRKKYIFLDLDGTIIDHDTNSIPQLTRDSIQLAQENGHEVIIATGRPKALFYDVEKELGIHSYIANNGRIVVYHENMIFSDPIPKEILDKLVQLAKQEEIDIAYEGHEIFALESRYNNLSKKFSRRFHLDDPVYIPGFYKSHAVYQVIMYYDKDDYKRFETLIPELGFHYSCEYGLDVNMRSGLKEIGVKKVIEHLGVSIEDTIAIGDGYNDITMLETVNLGIAMKDAPNALKEVADFITDSAGNGGIYHAFKRYNII